jgi:YjbE family integral membrane protein
VDLLAQFSNPGAWSGMLQASINDLTHAPFWIAVLQITYIDMLLSGDNAVVIAMACRGLPPRQRFWGVVIGAGAAVILRIIFTSAIAQLMLLPYLKLVGGFALIYIAAKLILPEKADKDEVEAVAHLWRAVRIVVVADVVMSLDNIIAIAAAARGNLLLLTIGLVLSIPLIIAGAALIMAVLDRFPILVWAGAALLGWIAGGVVATDPAVLRYVTRAFGEKLAGQLEPAAAGAGAMLVIAAGGLCRHRRMSKARSEPPREDTGDM